MTIRQAIEAGICKVCRERKAKPGHEVCESCLEERRLYNKARKAKLTKAGKCIRCGPNNPEPEYMTCPICLARLRLKYREYEYRAGVSHSTPRTRVRWADRKAKGLCVMCGENPPDQGHVKCRKCLQYTRDYDRDRRYRLLEEGRCTQCGKPKTDEDNGHWMCNACEAKSLQYQKASRMRRSIGNA